MTEQVVFIGAGMPGLTTAAYLTRAGLKVDVYEQHTLPGGYISSFVRNGFTFPAGPTFITSNGIVFPILKELGLEGKRKFIHIGHQMSWGEHDIPLRNPQQVRPTSATPPTGRAPPPAGTGIPPLRRASTSQKIYLSRTFTWLDITPSTRAACQPP